MVSQLRKINSKPEQFLVCAAPGVAQRDMRGAVKTLFSQSKLLIQILTVKGPKPRYFDPRYRLKIFLFSWDGSKFNIFLTADTEVF